MRIQKLGDSMLFGTDGIRGQVVDSPNSDKDAISQLIENRQVSARLMRLVGEALSRSFTDDESVIIGWDDRPRNLELVSSLTVGFHLGGLNVIHAGLCATPGLHNAILKTGSALGCMVTASHNPVSDSGVKVFDSGGFKTNPKTELNISKLVAEIANEDKEEVSTDRVALEKPDSLFDANTAHKELLKERFSELCDRFATPSQQEIIVDSSRGVAVYWLTDFLNNFGIKATEVSKNASALNEKCGAGEFSPTDSWTWEEAAKSNHLLIKSLKKTSPGKIIAAALDGDGDRCLLIESTDEGCRVVDGDEMGDHILRSASGKWHLAASIESDLALAASLDRLNASVSFSQTAVGDRWLSHELKSKNVEVLGVEDSGHLVMSAPNHNGGRCLVGDGVASMMAVLCAMASKERSLPFLKGYKRRVSISPSVRTRWTGKNELADVIEGIANKNLGDLQRSSLVGEENLMLLENQSISIGIRNSGTQAKTNVSLRVVPNHNPYLAQKTVDEIIDLLQRELVD